MTRWAPAWSDTGRTLASPPETRIQLCGRLVVDWRGERVEAELPGHQGRLLFAYLVLNRSGRDHRDALVEALWPAAAPPAAEAALAALLSKLRKLSARITSPAGANFGSSSPTTPGRPRGAREAIHHAESALAAEDWPRAWAAAQSALFIAGRGFLPAEEAGWMQECRRDVDALHLRALEAYGRRASASAEPSTPPRSGSAGTWPASAPLRESAYLLLMRPGRLRQSRRGPRGLRVPAPAPREDLGMSPGAGAPAAACASPARRLTGPAAKLPPIARQGPAEAFGCSHDRVPDEGGTVMQGTPLDRPRAPRRWRLARTTIWSTRAARPRRARAPPSSAAAPGQAHRVRA